MKNKFLILTILVGIILSIGGTLKAEEKVPVNCPNLSPQDYGRGEFSRSPSHFYYDDYYKELVIITNQTFEGNKWNNLDHIPIKEFPSSLPPLKEITNRHASLGAFKSPICSYTLHFEFPQNESRQFDIALDAEGPLYKNCKIKDTASFECERYPEHR